MKILCLLAGAISATPASARAISGADSIATPRDSVVLRLPEIRVDRERVLSAARDRLPTAFVSDLTPRRDARAVETVADVLSEAAGVHVDSYGGLGAFATVSLRGAPAGQVAVYLDGVPVTSAAHGVANLADLPITAVDRVEVYRGLSPLALGIATPGGAVNLVTRVPAATREIRIAGGAFGTWEAIATAGGRRGALGGLMHVGYQGTRGDFEYLDDHATSYNATDDTMRRRINDRFDAITGLTSVSWSIRPGLALLAREDLFHKHQGLPGSGSNPARTASLELLRSLSSLQLAADGGRALPRSRLLGSLDYESSRNHDTRGELGYGNHVTDDRMASPKLALELEWARLIPRLALTASADVRAERQTLRDTADGLADPPQSRRIARGASVGARVHPFAWLTLHGATRWDWFDDRLHPSPGIGIPTEIKSSRELDSPQAGVRITAPVGIELRGNWARAARAPGFEELFGRAGSVLGYPALLPERGENWDFGGAWSRRLGAGRSAALEWSHFESRTRDLIFYQRVSQYVRARNIGRALVRGEELSLRLAAERGFSGALSMTWQTAIDRAPFPFWNGKLLPLRPGRQAYARLDWRRGGLRAGADVQYLGDDWLDPYNTGRVPERTLVGASITVPLVRSSIRAVLETRNLGDAHVADIAGYPLPGRMFSVALDYGAVIP